MYTLMFRSWQLGYKGSNVCLEGDDSSFLCDLLRVQQSIVLRFLLFFSRAILP
jgi:hypothetical protein